jgi:hypothetical protein
MELFQIITTFYFYSIQENFPKKGAFQHFLKRFFTQVSQHNPIFTG